MRPPARVLSIIVLALLPSAVVTSAASATQRYASPNPANPIIGACTVDDPCGFFTAVQSASDGDEVIVEPGTYSGDIGPVDFLGKAVSIHGIAGQSRPVVAMNGPHGLVLGDPRSHVSDLELDNHGGPALELAGGLAERLVVVAADGCELTGGTLRDTVCVATATEAAAVRVEQAGLTTLAALRNVTAIARGTAGYGIRAVPTSTGDVQVTVLNTIAHGAAGDLFADARDGTATIELRASNYATAVRSDPVTAAIVDDGGHQLTAPLFADADAFDYHELAGSPTIRAGVTDPLDAATLDLDGEPRARLGFTDIGADEFPVPVPGHVPVPVPAPPTIVPPRPGRPHDTTAPVLSRPLFSVSAFAVKASARTPEPPVHYRASVRFSLSEAATVRGRLLVKRGHRWVSAGIAFSKRFKQGNAKLSFAGNLGHATLKPGVYRLALVATDAAKNRSRTTTLTLKVVRA